MCFVCLVLQVKTYLNLPSLAVYNTADHKQALFFLLFLREKHSITIYLLLPFTFTPPACSLSSTTDLNGMNSTLGKYIKPVPLQR
jgi:hypothetical protein